MMAQQPYGGAPPGAPTDPMGYGQPPGAPPPGYGGPIARPPGYELPPAPMSGGYASPVASGAGYEFNQNENVVINRLAGRLTAAGVMQIIFGAISLIGNFVVNIGSGVIGIPTSIALIVIGALFIGAAGSFRQITRTQGNDLAHLMGALDKLSSAALIQIIAFIVAVVLFVLTVIIVLLFFAALFAAAATS